MINWPTCAHLRYCQTKAIKPSADPKWEDAEDALHEASPNNMHQFLNWCLKLIYNPDGHHLKGYGKASSLKADWKYFQIYYTQITEHKMSKEMGEAVHTVCSLVLHAISTRFYLLITAWHETSGWQTGPGQAATGKYSSLHWRHGFL